MLWFGLGLPPILVGALLIAFVWSPYLAAAAFGVLLAWFYETGRTTCSRCAYYGTAKCGLPGLIAPLLTERKAAASILLAQIRSHRYLDVWILVLLNGIYYLQPWLLPVALIWSVGVWQIALGPKRHHGLLHRLRAPDVGAHRTVFEIKFAVATTIKHGPIANLDRSTMLDQVKAGDKVKFSAEKIGGAFTVTRIEPAQ